MSGLVSKTILDKDILSSIDDVILESSQQTIQHKVWNSLFANWEDGADFRQNKYDGFSIFIDWEDWDQILEETEDTATRPTEMTATLTGRNRFLCDHDEECHLETNDLFAPLFFSSLMLNHNIEAAIWWELNVGPCFARAHSYHASPSRVLKEVISEAWYDIDASQYGPEEQDHIIEILLSLDDQENND